MRKIMISWVALDRMVERKMADDKAYRQTVAGRPLRSRAKRLTDGELIAKLRSFGIHMDRPALDRLSDDALSAQELAGPLIAKCTFRTRQEEQEGDWIWVCLDALWQRWFPEKTSFEMLDDRMQAGYELMTAGEAAAACHLWLEAWKDALQLFDKAHLHSIKEFDDRFQGSQSLFNWVQELEGELWNAGLKDRRFLTARIAVCDEALNRYGENEKQVTENLRRAVAESYFELGETGKADSLYRSWLNADPRWGWGWIGWSDCYQFSHTEFKDLRKAEELLQEGLSIPEVLDAKYIAERLALLYEEQDRNDEASAIRKAIPQPPSIHRTVELPPGNNVPLQPASQTFATEGPPLSEVARLAQLFRASSTPATRTQKVGRNDPCPCGSGKKFKKCCGQ